MLLESHLLLPRQFTCMVRCIEGTCITIVRLLADSPQQTIWGQMQQPYYVIASECLQVRCANEVMRWYCTYMVGVCESLFCIQGLLQMFQRDAMVGIGVSLLALARCFSRIGCGCAVLRVLLSRARVKPGSRELPNDSGAGAYLILVSAVPWTPLSPLWGCSPALLDMLLFVAQVPYVAFLPDLLMASCCCLR